jgi:leucine dehydrogenase
MDSLSEIKTLPEFDRHVDVIACDNPAASLQGYIAIHRGGVQKPAFGATRIWSYPSPHEALRDALKLSRIMSYKSALAGLGYGGAKAVLMAPTPPFDRDAYIKAYAAILQTIPGRFMTGADVGVSQHDVDTLATMSTAIVGTKVNPVKHTVDGLIASLSVCIQQLFTDTDLSNRTFALQGLGKIGFGVLEYLAPRAKRIYVSDINPQKITEAVALSAHVKPVDIDDIYTQNVDIFSPCALSNTINTKTAPMLRCKAVMGSANVQLENDDIGDTLYKRGILYAPDYIVNAGGLISVVCEYENKNVKATDIDIKVQNIATTLKTILEKSNQTHTPPHRVSNAKAQKISDTCK